MRPRVSGTQAFTNASAQTPAPTKRKKVVEIPIADTSDGKTRPIRKLVSHSTTAAMPIPNPRMRVGKISESISQVTGGPDSPAADLDALGRRTVAVSVGRRVPGARVDTVHTSEGKGVRQAMDHLVALGHRHIVHIDGGRGPGSAERRRAYRAAMRRPGLAAGARVIPGTHTEESGSAAGHLLVAERDRGHPLPTAVLAGNDRCAMGLLMTLARAGADVPGEVSVVGYDDSHLSHVMPVGLTTVRQDAVRMAEYAVGFAVRRLEDDAAEPREAVLEPELVVRDTSAPPRSQDTPQRSVRAVTSPSSPPNCPSKTSEPVGGSPTGRRT